MTKLTYEVVRRQIYTTSASAIRGFAAEVHNFPSGWESRMVVESTTWGTRATFGAACVLLLWCTSEISPAMAQVRSSTEVLSCSGAAALVRSKGSVVLTTGSQTYDRFVAGGEGCDRSQSTVPAFERTADNAQCFIGYRCAGRTGGSPGN